MYILVKMSYEPSLYDHLFSKCIFWLKWVMNQVCMATCSQNVYSGWNELWAKSVWPSVLQMFILVEMSYEPSLYGHLFSKCIFWLKWAMKQVCIAICSSNVYSGWNELWTKPVWPSVLQMYTLVEMSYEPSLYGHLFSKCIFWLKWAMNPVCMATCSQNVYSGWNELWSKSIWPSVLQMYILVEMSYEASLYGHLFSKFIFWLKWAMSQVCMAILFSKCIFWLKWTMNQVSMAICSPNVYSGLNELWTKSVWPSVFQMYILVEMSYEPSLYGHLFSKCIFWLKWAMKQVCMAICFPNVYSGWNELWSKSV